MDTATRLHNLRVQVAALRRDNGMTASEVLRDAKGRFQGRIGGMVHEVALENHLRRRSAYTTKYGAEAFAKKRDDLERKAASGAKSLTDEHRTLLEQERKRLIVIASGKGAAAKNAQRDIAAIDRHMERTKPPTTSVALKPTLDIPTSAWLNETDVRHWANQWAAKIGANPVNGIHFADLPKAWGQYDAKAGRVIISRDVLNLPPALGEYVLAHELVHALAPQAGHNALFKLYLHAYMPDWQEREKALHAFDAGKGLDGAVPKKSSTSATAAPKARTAGKREKAAKSAEEQSTSALDYTARPLQVTHITANEIARGEQATIAAISQDRTLPQRIPSTAFANRDHWRANQEHVITDLAHRLQHDPGFAALAHSLRNTTGFHSETDPVRNAVDVILRRFAASTRESALAGALQKAVALEFGLPGDAGKGAGRSTAAATALYAKYAAGLHAFARAQYTATQAEFARQGYKPTDTILLFRGHGWERKPDDWQTGNGIQTISMQPLSSWTSHGPTSHHFTYGQDYAAIIAARVLVSRIFSTERTGLGSKLMESEAEAVILGGHDSALVYRYRNTLSSPTPWAETRQALLRLADGEIVPIPTPRKQTTRATEADQRIPWDIDFDLAMADWLRHTPPASPAINTPSRAATLDALRLRLATLRRDANGSQPRDSRGRFASVGGAAYQAHREAQALKRAMAPHAAKTDTDPAHWDSVTLRGHTGFRAIMRHLGGLLKTAQTEVVTPRHWQEIKALRSALDLEFARPHTPATMKALQHERDAIDSFAKLRQTLLDTPRLTPPREMQTEITAAVRDLADGLDSRGRRIQMATVMREGWNPQKQPRNHGKFAPGDPLDHASELPHVPHPGLEAKVHGIEREEKLPAPATVAHIPPYPRSALSDSRDIQQWLRANVPQITWQVAHRIIDAPPLHDCIERLLELGRQYPEPFSFLKQVEVDVYMEQGNAAEIRRFRDAPDHATLAINIDYLGRSTKTLREITEHSVHTGWFAATDHAADGQRTITHEFGHLVDAWLQHAKVALIPLLSYDRGTIASVSAEWRLRNRTLIDVGLGRYPLAKNDPSSRDREAFAEGFAVLHHGTSEARQHPYVERQARLLERVFHGPRYPHIEAESPEDIARSRQLNEALLASVGAENAAAVYDQWLKEQRS